MQPEPSMSSASAPVLDPASVEFYQHAMRLMEDGNLPFLVGGAYAFAVYTGIERHTKDFDVFIRRGDFERASKLFQAAGYRTELTFEHWLGKVWSNGEDFVDLIFSAGNGVASVDDLWFQQAVPARVFGMDVKLIPAEEMIWSKGLIMERERFDGADVAHLIRSAGAKLDWRRLVNRYGRHWRALFAHVILFGFIFPSDRSQVPKWVIDELSERLAKETARGDLPDKICYGTILSRQQYLSDVNERGYRDARLEPLGNMNEEQIAEWTKGIEVDGTK
ncbi:MAG TPA: nucleotidyltransferase family protein [Thermoanaerobaculia bacterium]|nr:nucleotidyltransferase family protein [Thermoanaerobaculia bacterium]